MERRTMEKLSALFYGILSTVFSLKWPEDIPQKHYEYDKIFGKSYTSVPELTEKDLRSIRYLLKNVESRKASKDLYSKIYSSIETMLGFLGRDYSSIIKNSLVPVETDFVYFRKYCLKIINNEFILMGPKQKYIYISLILEFLRLLSDLKMHFSTIPERKILDLKVLVDCFTSLATLSRNPELLEKRDLYFVSELNALVSGRKSFNVTEIVDYVVDICSLELDGIKHDFSPLQVVPMDYFLEIYQELIVYYKAKNDGLDSGFSFETKMNIYGVDPFWVTQDSQEKQDN